MGIDGLIVGGLPDNDLVLGDAGVFGRHARIDWDGEQASVTDLGSSSGTTLGAVSLTPHMTQPWNLDDELRIGSRTLRLTFPSAAALSPSEQTIATPVPLVVGVDALAGQPADAATMAVSRRDVLAAAQQSRHRHRRLPALAAVAFIAVLLSLGGIQALSSGGDGDGDGNGDGNDDAASLITVDESDPTSTTASVAEIAATETPAATATAPSATSTAEPTGTSIRTRTPTRTSTRAPTEPTAEPDGTAAPESTPEARPGSVPGPIVTPAG